MIYNVQLISKSLLRLRIISKLKNVVIIIDNNINTVGHKSEIQA